MASFTGDGTYAQVAAYYPAAAVVVSPRADVVPSEAGEIAPTQRDRMGWQRAL